MKELSTSEMEVKKVGEFGEADPEIVKTSGQKFYEMKSAILLEVK